MKILEKSKLSKINGGEQMCGYKACVGDTCVGNTCMTEICGVKRTFCTPHSCPADWTPSDPCYYDTVIH